MSQTFDIDKALKDLQSGMDLTGKDGLLMPLIKQLTEAMMTAEIDHHLEIIMSQIERTVRAQKP